MKLFRIQHDWEPLVNQFCINCANLNYTNNSSLKAMKWHDKSIIWYCHYKDYRIVSLSGIQPFEDGYRICFRGATLPGISNKILNKEQAIQGMKDLGSHNYYVTTNVENNHTFGVRLSRAMKKGKIWKAKIVDVKKVYNVMQEIWKIENKYYV